MEIMPARILSRTSFRTWLKKSTSDYVGEARQPKTCPIAQYLSEDEKLHQVQVKGYEIIGYDKDGNYFRYRAPNWAKIFIQKIDSSGYPTIDAKTALRILNGL